MFQAAKDPQRPTKYPTADGLDFTGIDAPTPISQIGKVERQNNLAINVFGLDKGVIVHHLSKQPEEEARINLLLIEKAGKFHYTWIKDLNRLLYDQSKHRERKQFCERCLHGYSREDLLEAHRPECKGIGQTAARVEMPEEGKNKFTFQNHHKQLPAPYIIYADFEALTTKVEGPELDPTKSNTQRTQHHEACSYCYVKVRCDGQTEAPVEYRGPDAAEHFLRALQEEERGIKGKLANPQAMRMTHADWETHRSRADAMCVTTSWKETLSGTTATSPVSTEEPPTAPAISYCGSAQRPQPYLWSFTTCGGTTVADFVDMRRSNVGDCAYKYKRSSYVNCSLAKARKSFPDSKCSSISVGKEVKAHPRFNFQQCLRRRSLNGLFLMNCTNLSLTDYLIVKGISNDKQ